MRLQTKQWRETFAHFQYNVLYVEEKPSENKFMSFFQNVPILVKRREEEVAKREEKGATGNRPAHISTHLENDTGMKTHLEFLGNRE